MTPEQFAVFASDCKHAAWELWRAGLCDHRHGDVCDVRCCPLVDKPKKKKVKP